MNVTIYISKENEERWRSLENKSQWVNTQLKGVSLGDVTDSKPVKESSIPSTPANNKDWQWDMDRAEFVNTKTGETRDG